MERSLKLSQYAERLSDSYDHHEISLNYGVTLGAIGVVESALHEIAHAAVLGIDGELLTQKSAWTDRVARSIEAMSPEASWWQEVLTIAAEVIVLKHRGWRVWDKVVTSAEARTWGWDRGARFDLAVRNAATWKTSERRARKTWEALETICHRTEGQWPT